MKIFLIVAAAVGVLLTAVFGIAILGFMQMVKEYDRLFREEER